MGSIAAIVPAHNEEQTIGAVVRVLRESKQFEEIIVVSDGSADATADRAREAGATKVLVQRRKQGKGQALLRGIKETNAPILFFADADLHGFRIAHVRALLSPVTARSAAMTVGLRDRGPFLLSIEKFLPLIGGERALRREVIEDISPRFLSGYKIEAALNYHCMSRGWQYQAIPLRGLSIRTKRVKVGLFRALPQYCKMIGEVCSAFISVRLTRELCLKKH